MSATQRQRGDQPAVEPAAGDHSEEEIELTYCVVNTGQRELLLRGLDAIASERGSPCTKRSSSVPTPPAPERACCAPTAARRQAHGASPPRSARSQALCCCIAC